MGVYTSSGVLSYVVKGSRLDTNLEMSLGTHAVTVKEWDNCGSSSGTALTVTVGGGNISVSAPANGSIGLEPRPLCRLSGVILFQGRCLDWHLHFAV